MLPRRARCVKSVSGGEAERFNRDSIYQAEAFYNLDDLQCLDPGEAKKRLLTLAGSINSDELESATSM